MDTTQGPWIKKGGKGGYSPWEKKAARLSIPLKTSKQPEPVSSAAKLRPHQQKSVQIRKTRLSKINAKNQTNKTS